MSAVDCFKFFLKSVSLSSLPLVLLRPREISEEVSYSGDYDFFIESQYNEKLLEIIFQVSVELNFAFSVSRVKHGKLDITIYDREKNQQIALEIWNILSVKDPYKKTLRYILGERVKEYIFFDGEKYVLDKDIEALYYLSHLYTGGEKT